MYYYDKKIRKEVSVPYPLYQSEKGEYFIGQDQHALTALVNPITSNVNIYVNAITVTNISELNLSSEINCIILIRTYILK